MTVEGIIRQIEGTLNTWQCHYLCDRNTSTLGTSGAGCFVVVFLELKLS